MNHSIRINVVGGSATTPYALPEERGSWPSLLQELLRKSTLVHHSESGLTLVKSLKIIDSLSTCDVLILHLGTSVGWPIPLLERFYPFLIGKLNEATFFQPPKKYNGSIVNIIFKYTRLRLKNFVKYCLALFSFYRPKSSIHEITDQVNTVMEIAARKATHVIWIQHQTPPNRRLWVEKFFYNRRYERLITAIKKSAPANLTLVELGSNFLIPENYLMDGVHLSEQGHYVLAHRLADMIKDLSSSNVETD